MTDTTHIRMTVFPAADKDRIEKQGKDTYYVHTRALAEKGAANKAAIQILRNELQTDKQIRIVSGHRSPKKIVAITKGH